MNGPRSHTVGGIECRPFHCEACTVFQWHQKASSYVQSVFPLAKGNCLGTRGLSSPLKLWPPSLSSHTSDSVSQAHLSTFPNSAPFPTLPEGFFTLFYPCIANSRSKTIKIPGPLQFAGFVPTFEFLLILLLTGHLLFCNSSIFSYHDAYMALCTAGIFSSWGQAYLFYSILHLLLKEQNLESESQWLYHFLTVWPWRSYLISQIVVSSSVNCG